MLFVVLCHVGGLHTRWSPCCWMECRFSALNSSPPSRLRSPPSLFLSPHFHLNNQLVFRVHSPAAMWREGATASSWKYFFGCFVFVSRLQRVRFPLLLLLFGVSFALVSKLRRSCSEASDPLGESERLFRRARRGKKKLQPHRVFFFLFPPLPRLLLLFPCTWISGHKILGVLRALKVSSLLVYVFPGLGSGRRECHSSAAAATAATQQGGTHAGATSCPRAAKEAKLCQVAAHPAADAKHSSAFSVRVSA